MALLAMHVGCVMVAGHVILLLLTELTLVFLVMVKINVVAGYVTVMLKILDFLHHAEIVLLVRGHSMNIPLPIPEIPANQQPVTGSAIQQLPTKKPHIRVMLGYAPTPLHQPILAHNTTSTILINAKSSNIDIAVIGRKDKLLSLESFENKLHRKININFFDVWNKIDKHVKNNLLNGIVLHGGIEL